jgi:hypothetical protein
MVVTSKRLVGTDFPRVRSRTADSMTSPTAVKRLSAKFQESHGRLHRECGNNLPESPLYRIASERPKMIRAAYTKLGRVRTRTRIALTVELDVDWPLGVQRDPRSPAPANGDQPIGPGTRWQQGSGLATHSLEPMAHHWSFDVLSQ